MENDRKEDYLIYYQRAPVKFVRGQGSICGFDDNNT